MSYVSPVLHTTNDHLSGSPTNCGFGFKINRDPQDPLGITG